MWQPLFILIILCWVHIFCTLSLRSLKEFLLCHSVCRLFSLSDGNFVSVLPSRPPFAIFVGLPVMKDVDELDINNEK